jgi:hypothetical protein
MSYFPRPSNSNIPEEVFFSILKYIQPGALWLFARLVSRIWKVHVDANIERYIKFHASVLKAEREKVDQIYLSGKESFHLQRWAQADSLYVQVQWKPFARDLEWRTSCLVLRLSGIDVPIDTTVRDMTAEQWTERVTFSAEHEMIVYGEVLDILRIEHFMFPGFTPETTFHRPTFTRFKIGSHVTTFNEYQIHYTIYRHVHPNTFGLSIHSISLPVFNLMTFSVPHVVPSEITFYGSTCKLRYTSPLFNTIQDELVSLPEKILAERQRNEHQRWKESMKPLCEESALGPLDRWCQMTLCELCCSRQGGCIAHLARSQGERVPRQTAVVDPLAGEGGDVEKQDVWGNDVSVSGSESDTLVDVDTSFLDRYGWEYKWMFDEPVVVPAPWQDRPRSSGAIINGTQAQHEIRRVNSCL